MGIRKTGEKKPMSPQLFLKSLLTCSEKRKKKKKKYGSGRRELLRERDTSSQHSFLAEVIVDRLRSSIKKIHIMGVVVRSKHLFIGIERGIRNQAWSSKRNLMLCVLCIICTCTYI